MQRCVMPKIVKKVTKGARGMPRLLEAKKDVISCEKPREGANDLRSADIRMGQPAMLKAWHYLCYVDRANVGN